MSGRADLIALAQTLGLATTDAVLLDRFYNEAILALAETDLQLEATFVAVTAGQAVYAIPAVIPDVTRIVAAFFGTREITETTLTHLTTFDPDYRTTQGTPRVWAWEHEEHNSVRLYPVPSATSAAAVLAPDPFGADYVLDRLIVWTTAREDVTAPWLDVSIACAMLARELAHSSAYRDDAFAALAKRVGQAARQLGGMP